MAIRVMTDVEATAHGPARPAAEKLTEDQRAIYLIIGVVMMAVGTLMLWGPVSELFG